MWLLEALVGPNPMTHFHTIGHSNRQLSQFLELLQDSGIRVLVDVRKLTGSTKYPHFNADHLGPSLTDSHIHYEHLPQLAGRRTVSKDIPFEVNAWWTNRSFHNYADYALSNEFDAGLETLMKLGEQGPVALMCSEAVWWRCHRRIITDYLLARDHSVRHILGPGQVKAAVSSTGAVSVSGGRIHYPTEKIPS